MPKPMLRQPQTNVQSSSILSATQNQKQDTKQMDKMKLDRLLRKSRSKEYMQALHKLDAGGHVHNQNKVNEIIGAIRNEFPEIEISGVLLGFVSICYLGDPYEVHTLDLSGEIIEHYKSGESLPDGMEKPVRQRCVADMILLKFMLTAAELSVPTERFQSYLVEFVGFGIP